MTSKEIRRAFLDFFASKGHTVVPSAPIVVKNDPTLMFTNAGMNQFKDIFLGNSKRIYYRATDSQKCLRVSGKHNDLEEVGHDTYHHTMFEMLGNWSFGDYFKTEAIDWAWELLTEVYKINKNILYATIFEGSAEDGTALDEEARQAWLKHLPADHIVLGNKHDNFWEMGDTGPCGPCSEIHVDIRTEEEKTASGIAGRDLVNQDNPHVIEIWNIVFMQYMRMADGHLENLPAKNIDTGMGFERLCAVLQGKNSNYDTDVFSGMIAKIGELSGHKYGAESADIDVAMRVVADHIRTISFSIADGQLPSNVKAGYVIRRILRRGVRYAYTFLGVNEPLLCRLVPQLVADMGEFYPEIVAQQALIEKVIREEESAFLRTIDRGIKFLGEYFEKAAASKVLDGKDAFLLYDTYGFPIDLTQLIASENGFTVDIDEFNSELQKQKDRARNATANEFGDWEEFYPGESKFVGYDKTTVSDARMIKQRTVVQKNKEMLQLVFDYTPFYGEMGGEIGDTGYIESEDGERINIVNTIKDNNLTVHIAERLPKNCRGTFTLAVDEKRRQRIAANHSCTHLLDQALREILGAHVEQKGSYVSDQSFRFDFSHFEKLTPEQIRSVEARVSELIRSNYPLEEERKATMEQARAMGAIALFGEKYGSKVRVVKFGPSVELCGGCHTSATGNIGMFKILSESAIAAGVRRIEAVTGEAAIAYMNSLEDTIAALKDLIGASGNLVSGAQKLVEQNAAYKKQIEEQEAAKVKSLAADLAGKASLIGGVRVVKYTSSDLNPALVRNIALLMQKSEQNLAFIAAFAYEEKPNLVLMYTADLVAAGHNACNDVREAARHISGGGGGQSGMSTAGGKNTAGLPQALEVLVSKLQ
ncbi:MAG: alanine--tRNA ligase [Bacteroidales bacterium]|nr:alanine--tRNA ligase [Bacteroidales bacterium]